LLREIKFDLQQLPSLNGLRTLSISIVLISHLILLNFARGSSLFIIPFLEGQFGVNVFFVISGFLITSLLRTEESTTGTISLKNFYIRRVLRIFPAYYFLLLVYALLQHAGLLHIPPQKWLTTLTYTRYLNVGEYYTDHAWSLSVEENFYLVWPLLFLLAEKGRKYTAIILFSIVPLIRLYLYFHPVPWITFLSPFVRIDSIALGCLIALFKEPLLRKCAGRWNTLLVVSMAVLFAIPCLQRLGRGNMLGIFMVSIGTYYGTLANLVIAFTILYSVYGPRNQWFRLLNTKPMNYIGVLSYSIYLWQEFFVVKTNWWVTHFPQNLFCMALAAVFSRYVIEEPFLKLKTRFAKKSGEVVPVTVELQQGSLQKLY
jgi:peptidoglycan/LPS O-acetylase OafA/YrhL